MQFYHIEPQCFAKEIPDFFFFWRGGEDYKTLKIHVIKEIFDNIHHTLCFWEIIKQNNSISYSKSHVPFHFAMELMQTSMKITFEEQFSTLCSLITLLRII